MTVEKASPRERTTARRVRWGVLSSVLALVTVLGVLHQRLDMGKPAGVDALCPFGGLETLASLVATGTIIQKVALSSVLLLAAAVFTALLFRRAFCGRICPLGYLQELAGGLGRRLLGRRRTVPRALDRPARALKYLVLAAVLYLTWNTGALVIRAYDPWVAYNHLTSAELLTENAIGLAVLGVSLAGSFVYDRFFCKYACPMGAFLGLISRLSVFKVRRSPETCIDCTACDKACPVNVTVSSVETVTSPECIDCGECVAACPVADTLRAGTRGGTTLRPVSAALLAVGTFAALVLAATAAGSFEWTVPSLTERIRSETPAGAPVTGTVPFDVTLIKGSTTLAEVTDATGIAPEVFTRVYGVPPTEQSGQLKALKDVYGCSPGDVRAFLTAYYADPSVAESWDVGTYEESGAH